MSEKRQHLRTTVTAGVKLIHPSFGSVLAKTRDMSNGGLFLYTGSQIDLPTETEVSVQAQDMMEDAPIVKAKIIRIDPEGIALQFDQDD